MNPKLSDSAQLLISYVVPQWVRGVRRAELQDAEEGEEIIWSQSVFNINPSAGLQERSQRSKCWLQALPSDVNSPQQHHKLHAQVHHEKPVVLLSYAVLDPGTVMVVTPHAVLAQLAVLGSHGLLQNKTQTKHALAIVRWFSSLFGRRECHAISSLSTAGLSQKHSILRKQHNANIAKTKRIVIPFCTDPNEWDSS